MQKHEKMGRHTFLQKLGFTGASLLAIYALDSCQTDQSAVAPEETNSSIDLSKYPSMTTPGSFFVWNNIVIANANGTYIAATLTCSHEGKKQITYRNGEWYCSAHGARFDTLGKGLNREANKGLTVYKTKIEGTILTISS